MTYIFLFIEFNRRLEMAGLGSETRVELKQRDSETAAAGAGLRVLEILMSVAQSPRPQALRQLTANLNLPRASLHRLLRTLEASGFLAEQADGFVLGPESYRLSRLIGKSAPTIEFPQSARPVLEWLAKETNETVILGKLSDLRQEIVYADVIVAESPLQYAVPAGDHRPLYSSATGKAVLAFLPPEEQKRYIEQVAFEAITPFTTRRDQIDAMLERVRKAGVIHDRDGHFVGAGATASPIFDRDGQVFAAVVVAGPNERMDESPVPIAPRVRDAGIRISRIMGYEGPYPPPWP
ncbi:IclR family transcriptional regulator [Novosphingobium album (ex Liu et al. 2023)]|uniref:IclR family transcriptional regulator n=1 Tax=Novosphingobium album (ex Liu et al. 2023) TaxID=3031130 RepID=A0ABT5WVH3_9SPHN|nr:IclR family transcriptional regulator [Novosphingobium album (ex Liu et al. 2023)]MDE8653904.1 IclR family transcriptional regulator [Novosphingobium album (ex Liu et al. 2023)]